MKVLKAGELLPGDVFQWPHLPDIVNTLVSKGTTCMYYRQVNHMGKAFGDKMPLHKEHGSWNDTVHVADLVKPAEQMGLAEQVAMNATVALLRIPDMPLSNAAFGGWETAYHFMRYRQDYQDGNLSFPDEDDDDADAPKFDSSSINNIPGTPGIEED